MNKDEIYFYIRKISDMHVDREGVEAALSFLESHYANGSFPFSEPSDLLEKVYSHAEFYRGIVAGTARVPAVVSEQVQVTVIPLTPRGLFAKEMLLERMAPVIAAIRQQLFHSPAAPFNEGDAIKSLRAAAAWLRAESARSLPEDLQHKLLLYIKKLRELKQLVVSGQALGSVAFDYKTLGYLNSEGQVEYLPVNYHSSLDFLEIECGKLTRAAGFHPAALVSYVLTDIVPPWPAMRIKEVIHSSNELKILRTSVTMEINDPGLPLESLQEACHTHFKTVAGQKTLKAEDFNLFKLVKDKGGPPDTAKTRTGEWKNFWRAIGKEVFGVKGKHMAAYMKYKRLMDKIQGVEI